MNSNTNGSILPKYNRIPSTHMADHSGSFGNDSAYNTTRTVSSSSASMVSTPSNNNRRIQRRMINNDQPPIQKPQQYPRKKPISQKSSKTGRLIKSKLLNLHQSSRRLIDRTYDNDDENNENDNENDHDNEFVDEVDHSHPNKSVPSFIIHKPINMNVYDYSVFTNYPSGIDLQHGEHLPPAIKESQIKAWESAEKIAKNVIFGDSDSDDESNSETEDKHDVKSRTKYVDSIPGFSKTEFEVVSKLYSDAQQNHKPPSVVASEEKRLLHDLKKKVHTNQERLFSQTHSVSTKRQIQITQKKEFLNRMFGYNNNLNRDYITNNSLYSALDNSSNIQKTLHEDKEEIGSLLTEDTAYTEALEATSARFNETKNPEVTVDVKRKGHKDESSLFDYAYDHFQSAVTRKLDDLYNKGFDEHDGISSDHEGFDPLDSPVPLSKSDPFERLVKDEYGELSHFTVSYLRKCIKEETEE